MIRVYTVGFIPALRSVCHLARAVCLASLGLTLVSPTLTAGVPITVDWAETENGPDAQAGDYGVNIWAGLETALAANSTYKTSLGALKTNVVRFNNSGMLDPASRFNLMVIDTVNLTATWDFAKINTLFGHFNPVFAAADPANAPRVLMNIFRWPAIWNRSSTDKRLALDRQDDFATLCAAFVAHAKANNLGIKYWQPFNELDLIYSDALSADRLEVITIFNACALAMRAADNTIQVGGASWANSYTGFVGGFMDSANFDFYSYHQYGTGSASTTLSTIYNNATTLATRSQEVRTLLNNRGLNNIPIWINEYNIYSDFELDNPANPADRIMASSKGTVFHALVMKKMIETGAADFMFSWNERDGIYGKINTSNALYPTGHLFRLANSILRGTTVRARTGDATKLEVFAVKASTGNKAVMLINRDSLSQTADLSFLSWKPTTAAYTIHTMAGSSYASAAASFQGLPTLTMAANSVVILEFSDASTNTLNSVFVDDTDPAVTSLGSLPWSLATAALGQYGTTYFQDGNSGKGSKILRYSPTLAADSTYGIYIRWTQASNRATNVPITISHEDGARIFSSSQKMNGAAWNYFGDYRFQSGNGQGVTISNAGTDGFVSADAVRFVLKTEIIVDDTASGAAPLPAASDWLASTLSAGYYGTGFRDSAGVGAGTKSFRFTPTLPYGGYYDVYLRWASGTDRASAVPVDIRHRVDGTSQTTTTTINQTTGGGIWNLLGRFYFDNGASTTNGSVTIRTNGALGLVVADAVRLVGDGPLLSAPPATATDTPLQAWRRARFGVPTSSGAALDTADNDTDGLPNLLEYALGGNPVVPDSSTLSPAISLSAELRLSLSFTRANGDINYDVLGSSDLSAWSVVATNPGTVGTVVTVADSVIGPRRFLRLRVRTQ